MPPPPAVQTPTSVATPLTWAGGIALLGVAVWLPSVIAIFRALAGLFR